MAEIRLQGKVRRVGEVYQNNTFRKQRNRSATTLCKIRPIVIPIAFEQNDIDIVQLQFECWKLKLIGKVPRFRTLKLD